MLTPRQISELLSPREFITLCSQLDAQFGKAERVVGGNLLLGTGERLGVAERKSAVKFDVLTVNRSTY
jgi:hypothetical protein